MDMIQQVLLAEEWQRRTSARKEPETMLHLICDKICGRLGAADRLQAYKQSISGIAPEDYLPALESLLTDLCCNTRGIPDQLRPLHEIIEQRRTEVRSSVIEQTVGISKRRLKDFDWSIKIVMGSDQVAAVRIPVFVLALRLQKVEGDVSEETVTLELDQNELGMVLTQLEKPMKAMRMYDMPKQNSVR